MDDLSVTTKSLQADVIELQTKLQFQEDTIQQLDGVIINQQELIDKLTRRLELLEERVEELKVNSAAPGSIDQEKPPHY